MKKHWLLTIIALFLAALACNWPEYLPPPAPVIEPTQISTFVIPTETLPPTSTALPTTTSTPSVPVAFPKDLPVNCRYGPGTEWAATSALTLEASAEILGKNTELTWWLVKDPLHEGERCWVSMKVTETGGNTGLVEIVPKPKAAVTKINVGAEVAFTACGGPNPVSFSGAITTNGPGTVTYHWEVGGDKQNVTPDETIVFSHSGEQQVQAGAYSADCGNYFIILRVTGPNEKDARQDFSIQAP